MPLNFKIVRPKMANGLQGTRAIPVIIAIGDPLLDFKGDIGLDKVGSFYQAEADTLADALFNSLPQGTLDRLLIHLMKRKLSCYRGITSS